MVNFSHPLTSEEEEGADGIFAVLWYLDFKMFMNSCYRYQTAITDKDNEESTNCFV